MRLELASFPVTGLVFADGRGDAGYRDGVLTVDRAALLARLRADARIADVDVDIARPG